MTKIWKNGGDVTLKKELTITTNYMNEKLHKHYEAPTTDVVEVRFHGILCESLTSPSDYSNGGNPFPSSLFPEGDDPFSSILLP